MPTAAAAAATARPQLAVFALLLSVACTGSFARSFCDAQPGWRLDWQDEFDGTSLNTSSWTALDLDSYDIGSCRDAACLPENVQVGGGALLLRSERQHVKGYNFTTGAVRTKGCWPDLGEMDILEMINGDGRAHATYHWDANYPAKNCTQPDGHKLHGSYVNVSTWDADFHEYALERGAEHVAFVYDGLVVLNVSRATFPDAMFWPAPWYIIINTAVGGDWAGPVGPNTRFPASHTVDYVRVAVSM